MAAKNTQLPKIASLTRISISPTNPEEVTQTRINSPESERGNNILRSLSDEELARKAILSEVLDAELEVCDELRAQLVKVKAASESVSESETDNNLPESSEKVDMAYPALLVGILGEGMELVSQLRAELDEMKVSSKGIEAPANSPESETSNNTWDRFGDSEEAIQRAFARQFELASRGGKQSETHQSRTQDNALLPHEQILEANMRELEIASSQAKLENYIRDLAEESSQAKLAKSLLEEEEEFWAETETLSESDGEEVDATSKISSEDIEDGSQGSTSSSRTETGSITPQAQEDLMRDIIEEAPWTIVLTAEETETAARMGFLPTTPGGSESGEVEGVSDIHEESESAAEEVVTVVANDEDAKLEKLAIIESIISNNKDVENENGDLEIVLPDDPVCNSDFDGWTYDQFWGYQHEIALCLALAHLIEARNIAARQSSGEAVVIGRNFFVPESESYLEDMAELYYHFNEVCANMLDFCEENHFRFETKKKTSPGPRLPAGFRKADPESRSKLSRDEFSKLIQSGEHSPWKSLKIGKIVENAKRWYGEYIEDSDLHVSFIKHGCFERVGHYCRRGVCDTLDTSLIMVLSHLERAKENATKGLEELSEDDPKIHDATGHLQSLTNEVSFAEVLLHQSIEYAKFNEQFNDERIQKMADAVEAGDGIQHLLPSRDSPSHWKDYTHKYTWKAYDMRKGYTVQRFFYALHIVMASEEECDESFLPPNFRQLRGYVKLQRNASTVFAKESIAARQSELLMRAGWGPPFLLEEVHNWIIVERELYVPDTLCHHTPFANRPRTHGLGIQVIDYLSCHLSWYARTKKEFGVKPTDPTWAWQINLATEPYDNVDPEWRHDALDPCTQMYLQYQKEAAREDGLDDYMPPGFRNARSDEERKALTEKWIEEAIQPTADYFFSKQGWNIPPKGVSSVRADAVRKKLLSCSAVRQHTSATKRQKEQLAQLPARLISAHSHYQNCKVAEYVQKEEAKLNPLIDHGLAFLLTAEGSYGTRGFRNSSSPAIRGAARKAVEEKDGLALVPFEGSLLCDCKDEEQHKLQLIDEVARAMCEKLNKIDDQKAGENNYQGATAKNGE
ncbi:uncharacterized protein LY89DRAFT_778447 [Mollisia scopiformis]|uniref:Uncharacterized protein n=1 Tax=Mollisia scopiformis TaxID=149040 RepID=A0A194XPP6_MOLSC|nr:uncharacterized protein LY89DRAFT_778447 [Mollisia scopiformis]KUJ22131.1 hypothetical protein LY89DRAFT_778447 [Mollisia scopiformis]